LLVVDTYFLVHAADRHSLRYAHCRQMVEGWQKRAAAWYVTWGIGAGSGLPHPHSASSRGRLRGSERCSGASRNLIHDATTAIFMLEHGIRAIYTFDTDFHRFPFLTVVDPGTI